jgi:broad specificity phosphatase PhoE
LIYLQSQNIKVLFGGLMKLLKTFFLMIFSFWSTVYGGCFDQDKTLVNELSASNVRLVVLNNFESTNNVLDIVTSSLSPAYALTSDGLNGLQASIPDLASQNISFIYASPAFRTQQSTNILGTAFNLTPNQLIIDSRLGTQAFGVDEGMDYNAYKASYASEIDMLEGVPPEGESGCSVYERTRQFLYSLTSQQNKTVLIITQTFNYCHISNILTGSYGPLPSSGTYTVYTFE